MNANRSHHRKRTPGDGKFAHSIKRILVPVDFSKEGVPAIDYAVFLAGITDASIILVHVLEQIYDTGEFAFVQIDTARMREHVSREIGALQTEKLHGVRSGFEIREGTPFHEICATAAEFNADLIVMATHGYTGLRHVFLGSTAERVVRHANCPVLVIPSRLRNESRMSSKV